MIVIEFDWRVESTAQLMATFSVVAHIRPSRSRFGCSILLRFALYVCRFAACVVCLVHGHACLVQCGRDQFVTWSSAVDESKHVIVRVPLTDYFNAAFVLQARQLGHYERLFCGAHVAIVDVECQTCLVWRCVDQHGVPVHPIQCMLVLFRSYQ